MVLAVFRSSFPKEGVNGLSKLGVDCVAVEFFINQGLFEFV